MQIFKQKLLNGFRWNCTVIHLKHQNNVQATTTYDVYAGGAASALCKASLFIFDLIRGINRLICIVYLLI